MNRFAKPDNFGHPIRNPLLREHFVYRAYNADGELLYVGCSKVLEARMSSHRGESEWYAHAASFRIAGPYNYETARDLERQAIQTERALYNATPERLAVTAAHQRIFNRRFDYLLNSGVDFYDAIEPASEYAQSVLPSPVGRGPWRCDDLTVAAALRADREDALSYEQVAS